MKVSIEGFNQRYSLKLKKEVVDKMKTKIIKIDCTDLVILRWFVDFYPKMEKANIDGVEYAWLSYQKLINDLPIIDITKRALSERLQKMVEFKILKYKLVKNNGTFTYYTFGENYGNMIGDDDGLLFNQQGGCCSNDNGGVGQPTTKDKTINYKTINNNKEIYKERFEIFWNEYPKKVNKKKCSSWFEKNKPNEELFNRMINQLKRFKDTDNWKKQNGQFIPHPLSWLNNERWEDEFTTEKDREEEMWKRMEEKFKDED